MIAPHAHPCYAEPVPTRWFFVRPSPELRRRIALAAATQDVTAGALCQRVIRTWLDDANRGPLPETAHGPFKCSKLPTSETTHRKARLLAAELDIPISTLLVRILDARMPYEVELLAAAMTGEHPFDPQQEAPDGP